MKRVTLATALAVFMAAAPAAAAEVPADPLNSVMWEDMANQFFSDGRIVFDQRVKVMSPASAENQMLVPVTVDARELLGVEKIVVVADLNPIPHVLTFRPKRAKPFIGFRLKVEQGTPIRVGVKTFDGTWHIGGRLIDAAGGGCTAPAGAHSVANWTRTLGETRAVARRIAPDQARVKVRMKHPMDTGLADGIPVFYMSQLNVKAGEELVSEIELFEPVSEDPTITLMPIVVPGDERFSFNARDTEGNTYSYSLAVPAEPGL